MRAHQLLRWLGKNLNSMKWVSNWQAPLVNISGSRQRVSTTKTGGLWGKNFTLQHMCVIFALKWPCSSFFNIQTGSVLQYTALESIHIIPGMTPPLGNVILTYSLPISLLAWESSQDPLVSDNFFYWKSEFSTSKVCHCFDKLCREASGRWRVCKLRHSQLKNVSKRTTETMIKVDRVSKKGKPLPHAWWKVRKDVVQNRTPRRDEITLSGGGEYVQDVVL